MNYPRLCKTASHTYSLVLAALGAIATSAVFFSSIATAHGEDVAIDRNSRAFKEAEGTLTKSTGVYKQISEGKHGKVPQSVLDKTRCVAVFPDTVTVSAGLGGTHGDGVGFCKTAAGTWENPMFLNLIGGSVGLQAGVKSADMVLYIIGDKAVVAYSRAQGLFVGAALDGVSISRDDSDERAFYGTREMALTEKIPADLEQEVNKLRNELPRHVG